MEAETQPPQLTEIAESEPKPQLPIGDRDYVACKKCHAIITATQYAKDGCQVCNVSGVGNEEVPRYATQRFSGFVGVIAAEQSWVAKLIGCGNMPTGVYAAHLEPDDDEDDEEDGMEGGNDANDPENQYEEEEPEVRSQHANLDRPGKSSPGGVAASSQAQQRADSQDEFLQSLLRQ